MPGYLGYVIGIDVIKVKAIPQWFGRPGGPYRYFKKILSLMTLLFPFTRAAVWQRISPNCILILDSRFSGVAVMNAAYSRPSKGIF